LLQLGSPSSGHSGPRDGGKQLAASAKAHNTPRPAELVERVPALLLRGAGHRHEALPQECSKWHERQMTPTMTAFMHDGILRTVFYMARLLLNI
jgi:hypothetical protein